MTRAACNDYEEASPNPPENVKSKPIGSQNAKVRAYGLQPTTICDGIGKQAVLLNKEPKNCCSLR
jgi:hypothetical protein